jgi:hypothetical protein
MTPHTRLAYSALSTFAGVVALFWGQVVEVVAGAGVGHLVAGRGARDVAGEPAELQARVVLEQVRLAEHGGGVGIDLDRPVDLVQAQLGVLVERAVGATFDAVADREDGRVGQRELVARVVGGSEAAHNGGVDDDVLKAGALERALPAVAVGLVRARA